MEDVYSLVFSGGLLGFAAVAVLGPMLLIAGAAALTRRRSGAPLGALLAIVLVGGFALTPLPRMGAGAVYLAVPPLRLPMAWLDLTLSRSAREEVIRLALDGSLQGSPHTGYKLPDGAKGLSVWGNLDSSRDECGQRFFFMTLTGFSPDPYAGFEHVPAGCEPETDPLGSGSGTAEPLGAGWFWIVAS